MKLVHLGLRQYLLGKLASKEQISLFSNECMLVPITPPVWITHAGEDNVVSVENSIRFYQNLIRNKVPTKMHLYPEGNHRFVLSLPTD
jgi:acetyl esterase/lipase